MEECTLSMGIDDPFTFSCTPEVSCFNECCHDLNQFLSPYDVMRLKKALKLPSWEFLDRYTAFHTGPESGLPVVTPQYKPGTELECPFLTPSGCSVYDDRPGACRAYPIARAIKRSRETGVITEYFMLITEPHCQGHGRGKTQTVRDWMAAQGLLPYNRMNDPLMEIISLKNRLHPGPLDRNSRKLFYLACYDIDAFRKEIFENGLADDLNPIPAILQQIEKSDPALLLFGYAWIKLKLFGLHTDEGQLAQTLRELSI